MPLLIALLAPVLLFGGIGRTVSYKKLTAPKVESAFYRCGGKSMAGKRVHIHVPAARIHAKPDRIVSSRKGHRRLVFKNRSVPLVVSPGDVYYRKALQRTTSGDMLCVKGTVKRAPLGGAGEYAIHVHTIKEAPGG